MIIGIDFDNTLVSYDEIFYQAAFKKKLIPKELNSTKNDVRNYLRKCGKENTWIELQGQVYGPDMLKAKLFPGVLDFFKYCKKKGITTYIISHRTRHPFTGPKHNLHKFAKLWLKKQGFFDPQKVGLVEENVFFELTKEDKLKRIIKLNCTHFIDDLPEFLSEQKFPEKIIRILFDPSDKYKDVTSFEHINSWSKISEKIK